MHTFCPVARALNKSAQGPATAEERRALLRAKQDAERKRLAHRFVDEVAVGQGLFRTSTGERYADFIVADVRQTWAVRSKTFRAEYVRYLRQQLDHLIDELAPLAATFGPVLKKSAIKAMIDEFEMRAITSSIEREVHVRVASDADHIYVDLGDLEWHAVRITAAGWSVVQSPPVRFRRMPDMRALPFPERSTPISALREFTPNITDDDFILVVALLVDYLQPRGPYPPLVAYGEHGSAKTSFLRILRALTDPNSVATTRLPLNARDFYIGAKNSHVQAFENVSKLSDAMSDELCRLATGGGLRTRKILQILARRRLPEHVR